MEKEKHPLIGNPKWTFNQPLVGVRAHYSAIDLETEEKHALIVDASSTCREGVIYNIREAFQSRLTNTREVNQSKASKGWDSKQPKWVATKEVDLADAKPSQLWIQWHKSWMKGWEDFQVRTFLQVCDRVLGPIAVLLGPWRPEGDWWRTDPATAMVEKNNNQYVYWDGTDNWFLAHPATAAIATGLYRQCFHLCGAGVSSQIIKDVSEEEISEVMSSGSQKLALVLLKKTRPWVEVPVGGNGNKVNYAFPLGFWRRLIRLQRAIRRHGYAESLGQSFHEGWTTTRPTDEGWRGAYGFWGEEGELTEHHRHLMKVGAPGRKKSGKSAKKAT